MMFPPPSRRAPLEPTSLTPSVSGRDSFLGEDQPLDLWPPEAIA